MDYKIIIDPGHGGEDSGASGNGIIEKNLTLDISKEMYNLFKKVGVPVFITRLDDSTLSPSERTQKILNAFGNNQKVIVISNHINAGGGDGAEVIYALRNNSTLSNLVLEELNKEGQNIRKAYQRRLPSDPAKDYYFIHRDTGKTEPIIIEYGFLDSKGDDPEKLKKDYKKYAEAVVRAVSKYIDLPYAVGNVYIVKAGDSLWSIAKKYDTTVEELKRVNNLTSNLLKLNQVLTIPKKEEILDYEIYIVKAGDTLYGISSKYNIPVNDLIKYNNLTNNSLKIGQELLIPIKKEMEEVVNYIVKAGDSLYKIANKYNTSVEKIKTFNKLTNDNLSIGQLIKIPVKEMEEIKPEELIIDHIVEKGDSLYSIARKYNSNIDIIKSYNNLKSDILSIGQIIKVPIKISYTVKPGDTLSSIASKFNITVQEIKDINQLTNDNLKIGQLLLVY